jgi:hypothetical protein
MGAIVMLSATCFNLLYALGVRGAKAYLVSPSSQEIATPAYQLKS